MRDMNRLWNCRNPHQGNYHKVLCVCSAGLLRSPTAAWVLSQDPWNYNTRACGLEDYALIPFDDILLAWADVIITMDNYQMNRIKMRITDNLPPSAPNRLPVISLGIPDNFAFRDPELVKLIVEKAGMIRDVLDGRPVVIDDPYSPFADDQTK